MLEKYINKMLAAARKSATKAYNECVPRKMAFQNTDSLTDGFDRNKPYEVVEEGEFGVAWVNIIGPGKNMISKEMKAMGLIETLGGGYPYTMSYELTKNAVKSGSYDRAMAGAKAFAKTLRRYGVPASATGRLT